ncbi:MAG: DUF1592 domain-containing protein [Planctomycetia bacterium]|nr:DUF1592 domain-containing protein [Planctomycetia bacterium]
MRYTRCWQGVWAVVLGLLSVAAARAEDFTREIRPILKTHCFSCHGSETKKGNLDLERFLQASQVVNDIKTWQSVVEKIRDGSMPPRGKPAVPEKEQTLLAGWVGKLVKEMEAAEPTDPGPTFPRRLTRREYRNAMRDLFHFEADVESYLPEARSQTGYDNQVDQLTFPPELLEKYLMLADSVVEGAAWNLGNLRNKEPINRWHKHWEGQDKLTARQAAERNLRNLARLAFRRPPEDKELELLLKPFDRALAVRKDFFHNQRFAIKALLVMPQYLYRLEALPADDKPALVSDYELAGRLTAFLWSSVPDPELLDAAEAGKLHQPDVLREQVRRMLQDPKGNRLAAEFPEQWLFGRQQAHLLDQVKFPDYTPALAKASSEELAQVFGRLYRDQRSLLELLDADYTFVNEDLAALYGIKGIKGPAMQQVTLTDRQRGGLLGMAIAHQKTSMPSRTSPTNRGKWVLDALLGTPPPPPPPEVANSVDGNAQDPEGRPLTIREKLDLHGKQGTSCANCHLKMDPLGYALEKFDPIGRLREKDGNQPVENTGKLPDGTELKGVESLKQVLLQRKDQFTRNLVEQLLTYALGRDLQSYDLPSVRRITTTVIEKQYRADVLIEEIVLSYPFRHKRAPREDESVRGDQEKQP